MRLVPPLLAAIAAAMLVFSGVAVAELSKDEYKARVEPICKTNKQASDRHLKGVRNLVKNNKLKQASERFSKAAAALGKAQKQLAAVEKPAADAARLDRWLAGIKAEAALMKTIARKLEAGDKTKASSLVVKLTHNATMTNNLVVPFAFNYCKIDPAKYS